MTDLPLGRAEWLARQILPHEPVLRAWLGRQAWPGIDTDDLVQESYAVLAGLAQVDHIDNPRAYLFRTAHSLALQHIRRQRIVSIQAVADLEQLEVAAEAPLQDRVLSDRQELQRLADAIAALPARCGEVFRLRKVDGLSQRDVAQALGLSESTVEKHMGKAVRLLMGLLGHGGNPAPGASGQRDHPLFPNRKAPNARAQD